MILGCSLYYTIAASESGQGDASLFQRGRPTSGKRDASLFQRGRPTNPKKYSRPLFAPEVPRRLFVRARLCIRHFGYNPLHYLPLMTRPDSSHATAAASTTPGSRDTLETTGETIA